MNGRLNPATLADLPAGVARPRYRRERLRPRVLHLGVGAFHRAHQAVYTEDAIHAAADDGDWGIVGVSLRRPDVPLSLAPQAGLYTVERLDSAPRYRVVGCLLACHTAAEAPDAVFAAFADPALQLVTITVTEKGYCLRGDGTLALDHPQIAADLARQDGPPQSLPGWIVAGLALRRSRGAGGLTILSCDNLSDNGRKLERAVRSFAAVRDPALADWIEWRCTFPNSMVDSIVPASDAASRARVNAVLGLEDRASVQREPYAQWVIEDRFAGERPAWELAGADIVRDVRPYERLKLHGLNAAHSALAYLGLPRGHTTVREAIGDVELAARLDALMAEEVAPALDGLPLAAYWRSVRERFANPHLQHRLAQIAEDGSAKLAQRVFPLLIANARAGRETRGLAAVVRAWLEHARAPVTDPQAGRLAAWAAAGGHPEQALADPQLFPPEFREWPALRQLFESAGRSAA